MSLAIVVIVYYFTGRLEDALGKTWSIVLCSLLSSIGTGSGLANTVSKILGIRSALKCLDGCPHTRSKKFIDMVKKIRGYACIDAALFFFPPAKIFFLYQLTKYKRQLGEMIAEASGGQRNKRAEIF